MNRESEIGKRMNTYEAAEKYPDSYILMRTETTDLSNRMGTILYIGDTQDEAIAALISLENRHLCGVIEGLNHQRSLGGIVIGE